MRRCSSCSKTDIISISDDEDEEKNPVLQTPKTNETNPKTDDKITIITISDDEDDMTISKAAKTKEKKKIDDKYRSWGGDLKLEYFFDQIRLNELKTNPKLNKFKNVIPELQPKKALNVVKEPQVVFIEDDELREEPRIEESKIEESRLEKSQQMEIDENYLSREELEQIFAEEFEKMEVIEQDLPKEIFDKIHKVKGKPSENKEVSCDILDRLLSDTDQLLDTTEKNINTSKNTEEINAIDKEMFETCEYIDRILDDLMSPININNIPTEQNKNTPEINKPKDIKTTHEPKCVKENFSKNTKSVEYENSDTTANKTPVKDEIQEQKMIIDEDIKKDQEQRNKIAEKWSDIKGKRIKGKPVLRKTSKPTRNKDLSTTSPKITKNVPSTLCADMAIPGPSSAIINKSDGNQAYLKDPRLQEVFSSLFSGYLPENAEQSKTKEDIEKEEEEQAMRIVKDLLQKQHKIKLEQELEIPAITIRERPYLGDPRPYEPITTPDPDRVQSIAIKNIYCAELVKNFPITLKYNNDVFSFVLIQGRITHISFTNTDKCFLHVDDGTGCIKVIIDNKPSEDKFRNDIKRLINDTEQCDRLPKQQLVDLANMNDVDFWKNIKSGMENSFLTSVAHILAKKLENKLKKEFPKSNDLKLGEKVTIVGRIIGEIVRKRIIFCYNYKRMNI